MRSPQTRTGLKYLKNLKQNNFPEAQILLLVDSLINEDWNKINNILTKLETFKNADTYEFITYKILNSYFKLFKNNETAFKEIKDYGNLSLITKAFQSCYIESEGRRRRRENYCVDGRLYAETPMQEDKSKVIITSTR